MPKTVAKLPNTRRARQSLRELQAGESTYLRPEDIYIDDDGAMFLKPGGWPSKHGAIDYWERRPSVCRMEVLEDGSVRVVVPGDRNVASSGYPFRSSIVVDEIILMGRPGEVRFVTVPDPDPCPDPGSARLRRRWWHWLLPWPAAWDQLGTLNRASQRRAR